MDHADIQDFRPVPFPALSIDPDLLGVAAAFRERLFRDILPLWSVVGIDRTEGGFAEALSHRCRIEPGPRRVRVTARQVYAFATAAEMGWNETAARACLDHGYRFLLRHCSAEGFLAHTLDHDGRVLDPGHDLYDQAFLVLAYAKAYRLTGDRRIALRAEELLRGLRCRFAAANGGFVDHLARRRPLRANPHMHLLEAALAWVEIDDTCEWREFADDIVDLFLTRLFDRTSGFVLEDFDENWRAIRQDGRSRVEPGHQFEWAWLLMRWEQLSQSSCAGVAERMIRFTESNGVDRTRRVAVNALWQDGSIADATARLWPQTERLKAWLALAEAGHGEDAALAERHAADAAATVLSYLDTPVGGLWHDLMDEQGAFMPGPAPASSLYHIICAAQELVAYCAGDGEPLGPARGTSMAGMRFRAPMARPPAPVAAAR
ncbi:AGE family epimerase/isomerase [Fulvimarina sp. 2208YS6-2-32]|uniref:AGE family epimerase/isomerase n=2 Tax=Fulvimarina uroteuthidis TaxID=3098149 RepID=A0ABU5I0F4_9HYPH|nr:AGE family epimerase/isomerase [Fulvimarina sp. 2208YS6-2-32]